MSASIEYLTWNLLMTWGTPTTHQKAVENPEYLGRLLSAMGDYVAQNPEKVKQWARKAINDRTTAADQAAAQARAQARAQAEAQAEKESREWGKVGDEILGHRRRVMPPPPPPPPPPPYY
jgi:hypothetical protein